MARMLERGDVAAQQAAKGVATNVSSAPAVAPTSYAPPEDKTEEAPAVKAIEQAITPPAVPAQTAAPVNPDAPATFDQRFNAAFPRGQSLSFQGPDDANPGAPVAPPPTADATPAPAQAAPTADVSGFKPPPAYLQAALTRLVPDPMRRAYLGHLASHEAQSPNEVSPTGASGPFQFTRSTGQQYGLVGDGQDRRTDIDASILAANKLTDDNAKVLSARLGRDPTPSELALAHQQGAVTAARMLTGTGNAPAGNLSVNNVPANAAPQDAAQRIMAYYGMPNPIAQNATRNRIAATLTAQGGPQANPTQPGGATLPPSAQPTTAAGGLNRNLVMLAGPGDVPPGSDIRFPANGGNGIRRAPPAVQVAQAGPQTPAQIGRAPVPAPDYAYVMPPLAPPKPPAQTPQSAREQAAQQALIDHPGNPYVAQAVTPILQEETAKRQYIDKQNAAQYDADVAGYRDMVAKRQEQIATQGSRSLEASKGVEDVKQLAATNALRAQFSNLPPDEVFKQLNASKANAMSAAKSLAGAQAAMDAFDKGIITGTGANQKLDVAKLFTSLGIVDKHSLIANTETFRSAMQPVVANILHSTSGTSQLSEGELRFAQRASAGDITLDPQSIRALMTIINKSSRAMVDEHTKNLEAMFGTGDTAAKKMFSVDLPPPLPPQTEGGRIVVTDPAQARQLPPNTSFLIRIPGQPDRIGRTRP
ncbi:MAG TPA: hypothetical protein VHT00_14300 [Stellaceae bacterium]|nr:hypothetical protein [Stellaceae bacterium]